MMNKNKLPENIRSIIIAIDDELKDSFDDAIKTIHVLLDYYMPIMYHRVNDNLEYNLNNNEDFIDQLSTIFYIKSEENIDKTILYEDIMERVAIFVLHQYWQALIKYAENNNYYIWICNEYFNKIITSYSDFKKIIPLLDKLSISVFSISPLVIDKAEKIVFNINNHKITINNLPICMQNSVKQMLDLLPNRLMSSVIIELDLSLGYFNAIYQILYAIFKDKIIKNIDSTLWERRYKEIISNKYIADGVYAINYYFYHQRGEINYIEYLMSVVIEYLLDIEKLKINDLFAYKYLKELLGE